MKTKLIKFFNLIKKDKQAKILTVMGIILLFIFTLGYSLSMFTVGQNKKIANIKVNDLSFNITTNSGESDDRILHLQAGKIEQFNIILTNLNKIDAKYEFTYELCNNQNCTETSKNIPSDISVSKEDEFSEVSGTINLSKTKSLTILTNNKSNNDYYIKLNLNAGYIWNDLELANQIKYINYLNKDIDIVVYVDGVEVKELPTTCFYSAISTAYKNNTELKDSPVSFNCNYATGKWSYTVDNISSLPNKLVVNFESTGVNALEYVSKVQELDSNNRHGLFIDPTIDKNVRYTGAEPRNYVEFANTGELWRIIGVFNNITTIDENNNEKKESLVKIIRNDSLGEFSWDSSTSSINAGMGINEWSQADLMYELNCDGNDVSTSCRSDIKNGYLSSNISGSTTWYNGINNEKTGTYKYDKNINSSFIDKVSIIRWNLGTAENGISAITSYNQERMRNDINNIIEKKKTWSGKIGLIYPSDYGYASTSLECREKMNSKNNDFYNCKNNNWLFTGIYQWLMTPYSSSDSSIVLGACEGSTVCPGNASNNANVRPSLYLKSNIKITSGTGEKDKPYILSL